MPFLIEHYKKGLRVKQVELLLFFSRFIAFFSDGAAV